MPNNNTQNIGQMINFNEVKKFLLLNNGKLCQICNEKLYNYDQPFYKSITCDYCNYSIDYDIEDNLISIYFDNQNCRFSFGDEEIYDNKIYIEMFYFNINEYLEFDFYKYKDLPAFIEELNGLKMAIQLFV